METKENAYNKTFNGTLLGKIKETLEKHEIVLSDVYFGSGAASGGSEIHINVKHSKGKYAIQFDNETNTLMFCEIEKRVMLGASLDLDMKGLIWRSIDTLIIDRRGVRGHKDLSTMVAAMPFNIFSHFLENAKALGFSMNNVKSGAEKEPLSSVDVSRKKGKEGTRIWYYTSKYERVPSLRKEAIRIHGMKCMACGFEFMNMYGYEFIEVHHIVPISEYNGSKEVNPETDMVCLCSNCHSAIHYYDKERTLKVEELRELIAKNKIT